MPGSPNPPLWLLAELTYRCPLHCVYCSNPVDYARYGAELATEDWLRVLREGRGLGATQLGFSGGEPLVRDDLEVLVAEARRLGYYSNLITSGVGLNERRIAALKDGGLDHIQVSFQDSTREINDFLSSTRTFELKRRVAKLVKQYDFPMVLNVVLHRLNIDHVQQLLEMALELEAEYVELANTQYYGWAYVNRDQLLPSREQLVRAEEAVNRFRERVGSAMKIYFVVPDYHERRPKACMNGWGAVFLCLTADGLALPCHEARMLPGLEFPNVRDHEPPLDLVRLAGLQPVPRGRMDEGALPQLPREGEGLRRLPLPGVHAHRRSGERRPGVRQVAASRARDPGRRPRERTARPGRSEAGAPLPRRQELARAVGRGPARTGRMNPPRVVRFGSE